MKNTTLSWTIGVGMTATARRSWSTRHRSLPSVARTPTAAVCVCVMYCRTPPTSAATIDAYPAASVTSSDCHTFLPVFLSRASIVPLLPPGVQMSLSPSIRTDSL